MMKFLIIFSFLVLCVLSQEILDPFDNISGKVEVIGTSSETVFESTSQSNILGGERDMIMIGTGTGNSANCASETFVEDGRWFSNNGQTCAAEAVLQYDGTDNSANLGMGLNENLNNRAAAFQIDIQSDLNTSFTIEVYSSSTAVSRVVQNIQPSNNLVTYVFPFGQFTGTADFSNVGAIQLRIEANINVDTIVTLFDLIANEASGRVFSDCNCNAIQDNEDAGVSGITVTASPQTDCPSGTATVTAQTNINGDYEFTQLASCTYEISISQSNNPCTTNSRTINVGNDPENINFNLASAGSINIPADTQVLCNANTDTDATGLASCSSGCGNNQGGEDVTFTDNIVTGTCDADFTIVREFVCTNQGQRGTQTIRVVDNNENPQITVPGDVTITCSDSTDPSSTGQATASDSCSNVSISFDDGVVNSCNLQQCGNSGTITRTWTAVDDCGSVATGVQIISTGVCDSILPENCPTPFPVIEDDDECPYSEQDDDDDEEVRYAASDDDYQCDCEQGDDDDDSSSASTLIINFAFIALLVIFLN